MKCVFYGRCVVILEIVSSKMIWSCSTDIFECTNPENKNDVVMKVYER